MDFINKKVMYMEDINKEAITIEDCLELKKYKNKAVVINDGKIINIIQEGLKCLKLEFLKK